MRNIRTGAGRFSNGGNVLWISSKARDVLLYLARMSLHGVPDLHETTNPFKGTDLIFEPVIPRDAKLVGSQKPKNTYPIAFTNEHVSVKPCRDGRAHTYLKETAITGLPMAFERATNLLISCNVNVVFRRTHEAFAYRTEARSWPQSLEPLLSQHQSIPRLFSPWISPTREL